MNHQPHQRIRLLAIFREKELWLLVLIGILYFYRPLFLGETLFFRDLCSNILIHKQLLTDFIQAAELPLWNPYWHGGQPYLAHVPLFPLYPFNLLYLFLPFFRAFNITLISHVIACAACTYFFARTLGFHPTSSFLTGVLYGFCGYTLSFVNHGGRILSMPFIPLLFLFWHLFLLEGKRKWFVITVIVGGMQVCAGSPETNVITLLSLLGWTLCYSYLQTPMLRRSIYWLLLGIFIIGVTSIQIVPTVEMILQSSRGLAKMGYTTFSYWSLYPKRLPELVFPGFLGHIDALPVERHFWGYNLVDQGIPYILSIYFGWIALSLAIIGGLSKRKANPNVLPYILPFRARIFLLTLLGFALLFSLGRFLPFFQAIYQYIPLITLFRHPIKLLTAGVFPVALLAGYASELLFGEDACTFQRNTEKDKTPSELHRTEVSHSLKMLIVFWSIAAILFMVTLTFSLWDRGSNSVQEFFFKHPGNEEAHNGLKTSLLHASALWLLMSLLYHYRRLKKRPWQHWILAGIVTIDLLIAGKWLNPSAKENFFTKESPLAQIVHREIGNRRLFRDKLPSTYTVSAPSDNLVWLYYWHLEIFDSYLASFYRVPLIFHEDFDGLTQVFVLRLTSLIDSLPWQRRLPLLSAGAVTLILTSDELQSIPGIRRIAQIPNRSDARFYLYRNENAAARVEFVTNWELVNSDKEAIEMMLRSDYDPRRKAVLQEPKPTIFEPFLTTPLIENTTSQSQKCDLARITKIVSNTYLAVFSIANSCDGYLVFSEPFYPGWRVYVDGKSTPILRANYVFSAIFLKTGEHKVERRYRPNSVIFGALSSLVFCGILAFIAYKG